MLIGPAAYRAKDLRQRGGSDGFVIELREEVVDRVAEVLVEHLVHLRRGDADKNNAIERSTRLASKN